MKYKIIVDKQSRVNPSNEKREYEIDIEELRRKGSVADSFVFTRDEAYVMRRLSLSKYHVLSVLPEPLKEPLELENIELFDGDNYIYVIDMVGNKFYAEYLLKNEFNDIYPTKVEMFATIETLANSINLELQKKVDGENYTAAQILLMINDDKSEIKIIADKIGLNANDVLNIIAGSILNLTAKNISLTSDLLTISPTGEMLFKGNTENASYIKIVNVNEIAQVLLNYRGIILKNNETGNNVWLRNMPNGTWLQMEAQNGNGISILNNEDFSNISLSENGDAKTIIRTSGITTPTVTQTSLKSRKKNIKKLKVNALELVKEADICEYNLKKEKPKAKKHIGLVIGEGYHCPKQVIDEKGEGVEQYSLTSLLWKAVQELTDKVERLEERLDEQN